MKILILGGTSDTRRFIETFKEDFIVTVATDYGYESFSKDYPNQTVHIRFTKESLKDFIAKYNIEKVIDTTHPFAKEITRTATSVCNAIGLPYEDHMRHVTDVSDIEGVVSFRTYSEAADYLKSDGIKSILLTTGSNALEQFKDVIHKCYVRVLPYEASIEKCRKLGVEYKNIIAMQGPFSTEFNEALLREIKADALVTKMSGDRGGLNEKIEACRKTKTVCVVITDGL